MEGGKEEERAGKSTVKRMKEMVFMVGRSQIVCQLQLIADKERKRRVELPVNLQCERRNNYRMVRLNQP